MIKLIKQTVTEFGEDKCSRMAAALAYYTAFSLAPLMILIITLCGFVWDPADVEKLMESEIQGVVGNDGAQQVKMMLQNATRQDRGILASMMSIAMLVVGATGIVGQLQGALNDTWSVQPDPEQGGMWNFITKRLLSFGMICGVAFLLLVSLVASTVLSAFGEVIAGWLPAEVSSTMLSVINAAVSFGVITLLFAVMFKYLPDAKISWSDVAVGSLVTASLFVAGKYAMGAYLGTKNMESAYGAAGSLALILLWIYYSAMILLFGAELTQVWAKQKGAGVKPAEGAVLIEQKPVVVDRSVVNNAEKRTSDYDTEQELVSAGSRS